MILILVSSKFQVLTNIFLLSINFNIKWNGTFFHFENMFKKCFLNGCVFKLLILHIFKFQGLQKFFDNVMQGILRHVNFDVVKCVLIASPGFVRDAFYEYMMQEAVKTDNKLLLDNKSKFLLIHASSGFKHSLRG